MDAAAIRKAIPGDAAALGSLHVASWRETYAGLLPEEMLAQLSVAERSDMWSDVLNGSAAVGDMAVFIAEDRRGAMGFGSCGPQRDQALAGAGFSGEIGAVYVLRAHQKRGVGRAIMAAMAHALLMSGHTAMSLWVLRENSQARTFYGSLGGEIVGEKTEQQPNGTLTEIAYGWRDLSELIGNDAGPRRGNH